MGDVEQRSGYVLGPGEGVEGDAALKASGASTGGSLTLIESRTRGGAPWHVHSREDECFYVLEGTLTVHCGAETFTAGPRSFVFLPRGVPHAWDVAGDEATLLIITTPGGFEAFLRDLHAAALPLSDEAADRIAAKYGLAWVRQSPATEE
jgi:quercetin dioxygenase-like cupin family protein